MSNKHKRRQRRATKRALRPLPPKVVFFDASPSAPFEASFAFWYDGEEAMEAVLRSIRRRLGETGFTLESFRSVLEDVLGDAFEATAKPKERAKTKKRVVFRFAVDFPEESGF